MQNHTITSTVPNFPPGVPSGAKSDSEHKTEHSSPLGSAPSSCLLVDTVSCVAHVSRHFTDMHALPGYITGRGEGYDWRLNTGANPLASR